MSDWKSFYRDEHARDAQTSHPSKEAATSQAVHLVLHQKCRIQKIEGPDGEVIDRETFEREHLKKPTPQAALLTPCRPRTSSPRQRPPMTLIAIYRRRRMLDRLKAVARPGRELPRRDDPHCEGLKDGSIIEFRSVVDAVRCALEVQTGMVERNAGLPPERRIEFRIGIHLGDVVEEADGDLMGDGVNVAARLEGICEPGQICLSEDAYRHVKSRFEFRWRPRAAKPQEHRRTDARLPPAPRRARGAKTAPGGDSHARRLGALACAGGRACSPASAAGTFACRAGYAPRFMAASVDDKLANAPRLSIASCRSRTFQATRSRIISPTASPTT